MFIHSIDSTEQHPPRREALCTEWLSSTKLLQHTAHSSW